jgi:hypothetical protein
VPNGSDTQIIVSVLERPKALPDSDDRPEPSNNLQSQRPEYTKQHALAILKYVVVPNANYPQPGNRFKIVLALPVFNAPIIMAPTIELNDQSVGTAIEIDDIRTDWMLTAEFHAAQSAVTK